MLSIFGTNKIMLRSFVQAPRYSLTDLNGRTIVAPTRAEAATSIELPNLSEGVYWLQIEHPIKSLILKVFL
jgi:hypothetical protein